jgi:hypothetical protein
MKTAQGRDRQVFARQRGSAAHTAPAAPSRSRTPGHGRGHVPACLEPLEARRVLAAVTWDAGGGDGLWSNPLNWSADILPTHRDDVAIDFGSNRRVIAADIPVIRVKSLRVNEVLIVNRGTVLNVNESFDLDAQAALRINGLVNWAAGTWASDRPVAVNVRGVLHVGSSATPDAGLVTLDADLSNRGSLSWRGGDLVLGGVLTNQPWKMIAVSSPMTLSGPGELVNHALLRRGGDAGTTTTITASFTSDSRVHVLRGTLALGQFGLPGLTTISGVAQAVYTGTALRIAGASASRDAAFAGRGQVRFTTGTHEFAGANEFGLSHAVFMDGAVARIAPDGAEFGGSILFDDATIVLDGDLDLIRGGSGSWQAESVVELRDADLIGGSVATIRGEHTALVLGDAFVNASLVVETSRFEPGGGLGVASGLVVGPEGTLTSRAYATSGGIAVASGGVVVVERSWSFKSDIDGVGSGAGTIVILWNVGFDFSEGGAGGAPVQVTVEPRLDVQGRLGGLRAHNAIVELAGGLVNLAPDPMTGRFTLSGGEWAVSGDGQFVLPTPIEVVGTDTSIVITNAQWPALEHLVENRGSITLNGQVTFSTVGQTIANFGEIRMDSGRVNITTPLENHEGASIKRRHSTFLGHMTFYGALDAQGLFINRGTIDGEIIVRLDQGSSPGTMVNRGVVDATFAPMSIVGSFRNAPDGVLRLTAEKTQVFLTVEGGVVYGGELLITLGLRGQYLYLDTPIVAETHAGMFDDVTDVTYQSSLGLTYWYDTAGAFIAEYKLS